MSYSFPEKYMFRFRKTKDETLSVLCFGDDRPVYICEDPDKNNMPNVSCIPEGRYLVSLEKSDTCKSIGHDAAYTIQNVPGRSLIRIHPGNDECDTMGCLLPGDGVDLSNGSVTNSRKATKRFYDYMNITNGDNPFYLNIIDISGGII